MASNFFVAKLDLLKHASKRFLMNKPNFVQNTPQLQTSRQSWSTNELITTQMDPEMKDSFRAADKENAITNSFHQLVSYTSVWQ